MIVVFSGRPGVGKTTCAKEIIAREPRAHMLTSVTTRAPRPSDLPNEYEYTHNSPFMKRRNGLHFLWTVEYPKFSHTYYGTEYVRVINALARDDRIAIMILVPSITHILLDFVEEKDKADKIFCFYFYAQESILIKRLRERGETNERISKIITETRNWDTNVFSCGATHYQIINNETPVNEAVETILSVVR